MQWVCSQLGSREHYSIPRILHKKGKLGCFLTDFWGQDYPYLKNMPIGSIKKMAERQHSDLISANIIHLGLRRIFYEGKTKLSRSTEWETIVARNLWFQREIHGNAAAILKAMKPVIFFSYSYTALELSKWLKELGWKIVIGQIDPGKLEEDLVATEEAKHPEFESLQKRAPAAYWENWTQEMRNADAIIVNSDWSKDALLKQGLDDQKIKVVPLAYSAQTSIKSARTYPKSFTIERPLRVLFLGQVNLRKGIHYLLKAMELLKDFPIQIDFVGPNYVSIPDRYNKLPVKFHGAVPRSVAEQFYANADIFILPTLSDGFAITQLEALGKSLQLLVSKNCAEIVAHGINGYQLESVTSEKIYNALKYCVTHPGKIEQWSNNATIPDSCTMEHLGLELEKIEEFLVR